MTKYLRRFSNIDDYQAFTEETGGGYTEHQMYVR